MHYRFQITNWGEAGRHANGQGNKSSEKGKEMKNTNR